MEKISLLSCHIASFTHNDGVECFQQLHIGSELTLLREPENRYDAQAVAIYYGAYKLGFIPSSHNELLSKLLDCGYSDIFEVRINRINPEEHPEHQVSVLIRLLPNDSKQ